MRGKLDKNTFYRQEKNGLTLYNLKENVYRFYESIVIENKEQLLQLDFAKYTMSTNIKFDYPLCICCLVENSCNLDCLYCFGDDKMYHTKSKASIYDLYYPLIQMHPIQVSLGGGEPTLNKNLNKIIEYLSWHEIAVILDTNGTTDNLRNLISILKKNDVLVRISIDALNDEVINQIRPYKYNSKSKMSEKIKSNINMLLENNIDVSIQTVLSKKNMDELVNIADYLQMVGIDRWHIAGVKYSEKCKMYYDDLKISDEIINDCMLKLNKYQKQINITYAFEKDYGKNARLFFDVNGDFLTDSITNGLNYLGKFPTLDKLYENLDKNAHIKRYLGDFYLEYATERSVLKNS